ncbi:MAG: hypothetical protein LBS11_09755, partial [Oscillospiraceae bacterium]|nr:hypothetical protein [Oscillospiraceae bacterium]
MDIRYEPLFHIVMLLYPDLAVRMLAQLHPDMRPRALRFIIKGEKGESNIIEYDEKTGVTPTDEQIQQATLQFEKSLKMSPMSRGVRFDVYFEDDVAIINFEMQRKLEKYIDYRLHLSSSMILAYQTEINAEYKDLKPVYITFLCIEDPYDCGMRKYTWNTVCQEAPGLKQSYAPVWTVYNASGYKGEVGEDIHDLLEYFRDPYKYDISKTKNKLIPDLQEAARKAALDRRTREMLTRSEIWLQSIEANAMLRGEEIGLEK